MVSPRIQGITSGLMERELLCVGMKGMSWSLSGRANGSAYNSQGFPMHIGCLTQVPRCFLMMGTPFIWSGTCDVLKCPNVKQSV